MKLWEKIKSKKASVSLFKEPKIKISQYEISILICYLLLCAIGLHMNANISSVNESTMSTFIKQLIWVLSSFFVLFIVFRFVNISKYRGLIPPLLLFLLALNILVLFIGKKVNGAQRYLFVKGVCFQPSLPIRVALVLYFAYKLDQQKQHLEDSNIKGFFKHYYHIIVITLLIYGIILWQRHLSVIIISALTLFSMLWIARIRLVTLTTILVVAIVGCGLVLTLGPSYRGRRVEIYKKYSLFLRDAKADEKNIDVDDKQIKESLIGLSQGKFFGTTSVFGQAKNRYLAASTTDYIYSVIGEEHGFIGALFVFGLYVFIFFRGMKSSWMLQDFFLKLTGIGLTLNIFFNALVNIGVAMSALPSTGVTLPFISYGGTSMLTNSICIGLLLNITAVRKAVIE